MSELGKHFANHCEARPSCSKSLAEVPGPRRLRVILDRFRLDDKVAIVTGAGRGIGAGIALAFAEAGAHVVLRGAHARAVEEIADAGARARAAGAGRAVRRHRAAQLEELVAQTMHEFGRIDILVNNAGGWPPQAALETSERSFEQALHFNVTTAFLLTRFAVPHMLASGGGSVVNISSAAGRLVMAGFVAYGTAKAALSFMTASSAASSRRRCASTPSPSARSRPRRWRPFLTDELRAKMEALTPMRASAPSRTSPSPRSTSPRRRRAG